MQQNDLPTSLSSKWSFLFNCIEQISHLTTVAPDSDRLTWLQEFIKQHTLHIPPDVQKDFSGVSKVLLSLLASNEMHELSRRPMLSSESS
uniref:Uncharacterized protein n=1 Tax=Heterorhabditis bacteriophora TaxID=37862 RepID=A0A1I7W8F9_HETBA